MHATTPKNLLFLLAASTSVVPPQQVYKCSDGRNVAYQSSPCGASQKTLKQWLATPDPTPTANTVPASAAKGRAVAAPARTHRAATGKRASRPAVDPADARCNAAKARREAKLEAVGLKRTFDLLRKLDEQVRAACR